jgi:hypothetical protein
MVERERGQYLCKSENVSLDSFHVQILVLIKEEDGWDVVAWGRGSGHFGALGVWEEGRGSGRNGPITCSGYFL